MQIAVPVEISLIAGAKPSAYKGARVCVRIIFISPEHIPPLNGNLTALIGSEMVAVFVHDADAKARAHSHGASLAMPRRQRIRSHLMRRFGHSIGFDKRHAKQ